MTILKLSSLLLLLTVTFASKQVAHPHRLRDDGETETEIEEKSDYEKAGTNFNAFNYGLKGDELLSANFSKCGLQYLQWDYLELPAYKVKSRYARTNREQIYNATMFAQNTSEMLEWCTRTTHDIELLYTWKFKAFGGKGGYSTAFLQNLLGNAIRIEAINEKIEDNTTSEVYKWFYQGRLANIMLNFTPPAEDLTDDYQSTNINRRLMSVKDYFGEHLFQSNLKLKDGDEGAIPAVEGEPRIAADDADSAADDVDNVAEAVVEVDETIAEDAADGAEAVAEDAAEGAEDVAEDAAEEASDIAGDAAADIEQLNKFFDFSLLYNLRGVLANWKGFNIGSEILSPNIDSLLLCDNVITLGYLDQWAYARHFQVRQNIWVYLYAFYAMMYNSYDLSIQCINYGDQFYGQAEAILKEDREDKRRVILNTAFNYYDIMMNANRVQSFWQQKSIEQPDGSMTTVGDDTQDYYNAGWALGRIIYHIFLSEPVQDTADPVSDMHF